MKSLEAQVITNERDYEKALQIRQAVFCVEQGVAVEVEIDEYDGLHGPCQHVLVSRDGQAAGTGRLRVVDGAGKLERICVLASMRQYGVGRAVMEALERIAADQGLTKLKLHGQTQAEGFYRKLGYRTASGIFMEEGIPHVVMTKELAN
jgi:predicted GNAT family N-acyltransferase